MSDLVNLFGAVDGAEIPGGCERCDAFQTLSVLTAGVWHLVVHHDDGCPVLEAVKR